LITSIYNADDILRLKCDVGSSTIIVFFLNFTTDFGSKKITKWLTVTFDEVINVRKLGIY